MLERPPSKCSCFFLGTSKFRINRIQSRQLGAKSVLANVESVVAYAQSSAWNQYRANSSAPTGECFFAIAGILGGFSPGRTFGPVVATEGELTELCVNSGGELECTAVVVRDECVGVGVGEGAFGGSPEHAALNSAISAIGATRRYRTLEFWHACARRASALVDNCVRSTSPVRCPRVHHQPLS